MNLPEAPEWYTAGIEALVAGGSLVLAIFGVGKWAQRRNDNDSDLKAHMRDCVSKNQHIISMLESADHARTELVEQVSHLASAVARLEGINEGEQRYNERHHPPRRRTDSNG